MPKQPATSTEPKPKRTRTLSPEMAALRDEHNAKVAALHASQMSAKTLAQITKKLLPKLTAKDIAELNGVVAALAMLKPTA